MRKSLEMTHICSSYSTELSETKAEDILNLDFHEDKIEEMKKL